MRLELLRELLGPKALLIGVLANPRQSQYRTAILGDLRGIAHPPANVSCVGRKEPTRPRLGFHRLCAFWSKWGHRQHLPVLHYCTNHIVALAANHAISAIYGRREFAAVGGLISYGESLAEAYRQLGLYAAKILKGARTTNLPVMQLAMVELVINN